MLPKHAVCHVREFPCQGLRVSILKCDCVAVLRQLLIVFAFGFFLLKIAARKLLFSEVVSRGKRLFSSDDCFDAPFRVHNRDHLQIIAGKKFAQRFLIEMLGGCDHVAAHNVLDGFVAAGY